ncbi:hypothetical protein N7519_011212 [Penicillium mononematosum]|uniref:uncharacterized protein n=1 Tax=Penicillium mononematosum TaxID=268346 RepID=UPI00254771CF|nr:uncharacterized protein N7519_011212 [Penicillium mononematosum]KAJ6180751.1 hypothetical protein N7519_011212 [Penicillium mononematosum]
MGKEEEGKTVSPGPDEGFYNLPRGVFCPADAPILAEANVMARIAKASKEPLDHSGQIDSHPLPLYLQSPSSVCTYVSVSARRFASWTALTPLRVGKKDSMCLGEDASLPSGFPPSRGGLVRNRSRSTPLFLV